MKLFLFRSQKMNLFFCNVNLRVAGFIFRKYFPNQFKKIRKTLFRYHPKPYEALQRKIKQRRKAADYFFALDEEPSSPQCFAPYNHHLRQQFTEQLSWARIRKAAPQESTTYDDDFPRLAQEDACKLPKRRFRRTPDIDIPRIRHQWDQDHVKFPEFFEPVIQTPLQPFAAALDPLHPKWAEKLHPQVTDGMDISIDKTRPPKVSHKERIRVKQIFGKRGFLRRHIFAFLTCRYCAVEGHTWAVCEFRPHIRNLGSSQKDLFLQYVISLPAREWSGWYLDDLIGVFLRLPMIWDTLCAICDKFWVNWQFDNPFPPEDNAAFCQQARTGIDMWYAIGTPKSMLSKIICGNPDLFIEPPPRAHYQNHISAYQHAEYLNEHLMDLWQRGIIMRIPPRAAKVILPIGVVEGKKLRMVLDGSPLSPYTPNFSFSLSSIADVGDIAFPDAVAMGWDAADAFFQNATDPLTRLYQCFEWKLPEFGRVTFCSLANIMGKKLSPIRYHKRISVLVYFLSKIGLLVQGYLDDNALFCPRVRELKILVSLFATCWHAFTSPFEKTNRIWKKAHRCSTFLDFL